MVTSILTAHARERCAEMKVAQRRVKYVAENPDVDYCSRNGRVAFRNDDPTFSVVYKELENGARLIITVVWRTLENYDRETYQPDDKDIAS